MPENDCVDSNVQTETRRCRQKQCVNVQPTNSQEQSHHIGISKRSSPHEPKLITISPKATMCHANPKTRAPKTNPGQRLSCKKFRIFVPDPIAPMSLGNGHSYHQQGVLLGACKKQRHDENRANKGLQIGRHRGWEVV
jgi:hypothetical protein